MSLVARLRARNELVMLVALIVVLAIFGITNDVFLSPENLGTVADFASPILIVAFGMTVVMIAAGIDLSVGAVAAFVSVVVVWLTNNEVVPLPVAMIVGILVGVGLGMVNGLLVVLFRIPDFIATLAMLTLLRGAAYILSGGFTIRATDTQIAALSGEIGDLGLPVPVVIMGVVFIATWLMLRFSSFGRSLYAAGGSREVARLVGLRVSRLTVSAYIICAGFAALAGLIEASRTRAGSPVIGSGWELAAITIVVLGGTNLFGGRGGVVGTLLAGLMLGALDNWIGLQAYPAWASGLIRGSLLIIVVAIAMSGSRKAMARKRPLTPGNAS